MVKNKIALESTSISEIAIHGIQEKKGNDIVRLDLEIYTARWLIILLYATPILQHR